MCWGVVQGPASGLPRAVVGGVLDIAGSLDGSNFRTGALNIMHHLFGGLRVGRATLPTRSGQAVAL
jgi:hypothetical protein